MKKKKDLIIVLHYTTIATIKTTKKKQQKTKNLSEDIYTFFPVSLSDIVCTPRHFSSHLCLITGLFFDNFWLLIRPCCLIVYIFSFSFSSAISRFFFAQIYHFTNHVTFALSKSRFFFRALTLHTLD